MPSPSSSILPQLQKIWKIVSFDFHVKGYWDMDTEGKSFDLRDLKTAAELSPSNEEKPYLSAYRNAPVIQFDQTSFYEIDRVNEKELVLTYCVSIEKETPMRMFTIGLVSSL